MTEKLIIVVNSWFDMYFTPHSLDSFSFGLLPLLPETLDNMCIAIIYLSAFDVMNFEITFLPSFPRSQKVRTQFKYLKDARSF